MHGFTPEIVFVDHLHKKKTNVHFLERKLTVKHRQNFALSRSSKVQLGERDSADDIEKPTIE